MANYKKLGKNIIALTIGNFSSKILTFLLVPFYTAILTTAEYGTADLITTTINLALPVFTLLIYEAVMRFALDGKDHEQIFSWGFYITLFGALGLACCSPILFLVRDLKEYVLLFLAYFVTLAFYNFVLQFIKGIERVITYSALGIVNTFIYILCNLLFLLVLDLRVEGYILASVVSHLLVAIIGLCIVKFRRYLVPFKQLDKAVFRNMVGYSAPMIPNSISWWINSSLNKYVLVFTCGAAANGLYSAGNKIPTILTVLVTIFIGAWQISAVENFGSEESKRVYGAIYNKYETFLYMAGGAMIFAVKLISKILLSRDFYAAWQFTPILIYAFILSSQASFFGSVYTSAKKTKMLLISTLIGAAVNIVLNLLLVKPLQIFGVAIATMVGYGVILLVRIFDTRKLLPITIHWRRDALANLLLIVEMIIVCTDMRYSGVLSAVCLVILLLLNGRTILEIANKIFRKRGLQISERQDMQP